MVEINNFEYRYGYLCGIIVGKNGHSLYFTKYRPNCRHPKITFKKIVKYIFAGV